MSTDLKPVPAMSTPDNVLRLTQYAGPQCDDRGDRRRLQVTQGTRCVSVSKEQAVELARALLEWSCADEVTEYFGE